MIGFLLLMLGFGAGTIAAGWWGVALVGALWGLTGRAQPWRAGGAAALAWVLLLAFTVEWAPLARLAPRVAGVVGLPGWLFLLAAPAFAWLLAWSATRLASGLVPARPLRPEKR
ncbi:MAG: hypothetical protein U0133_14690 [Gemmatimonadales bacterium]